MSLKPNELPIGWTWTTLGEVCDRITDGTHKTPKYVDQGVPFISTSNIVPHKRGFDFSNYRKFISVDEHNQLTKRCKPTKGDVLISKCGTIGRAKVVDVDYEFSIFVGLALLKLRNDVVSGKYLEYLLMYEKNRNELEKMAPGSTRRTLTINAISRFRIPLPPLNEQRRIVAKIEALLAESKTAREALEKVPVLLRRFRQSVLAKAFRGELTQRDPNDEPAQKLLERIRQERKKGKKTSFTENQKEPSAELPRLPETWIWTTIGKLETFIGSGITPRGGKKVYLNEGIPFIRSQNVHPDGIHLENIAYITPEMHAQMKRTQVRPNDVLLNITGASIGRSTYIPEGFGEANVNQHVCIIRTGWWIVPAYLSHFLNSTYGQNQILATESGVTREGLNYTQVRNLWVPLAPVAEQKRVVAKIEEAFSSVRQIEDEVKKARDRAERMDQAILAKAFRGELVPQDPNDEPASIVLERVRTSYTASKTPKIIQKTL